MTAGLEREALFRDELLGSFRSGRGDGEPPGPWIEGVLRAALLTGLARPGDRLPSVREVAEACRLTRHATVRAYESLAQAGLLETREGSGTFVTSLPPPPPEPRAETARWLVEILAQGYEDHRVKIRFLPDLIRSWTSTVPLRVACVEAVEDLRVALSHELADYFGLETTCVPFPGHGDPPAVATREALLASDLWATTAWHAAELRPVAEAADRTLIAGNLDVGVTRAIERRLGNGDGLTVVCVDPGFGERLRLMHGGRHRKEIRIVAADDESAVASLDRSVPLLLTQAAQERLGERANFRLVAPVSPLLSAGFTRTLLSLVVSLNVERAFP